MRSADARAEDRPSLSPRRPFVARPRLSWSLLTAAVMLLTGASFASPALADLVVIQDSNGFPGGGQVEDARQRVSLGQDQLRVLDEQHGWALYVLRDKKVVREGSAGDRTFVEKPFSDYQKIREGREATRAANVAEYHRQLDKAKDDATRADLKKTIEAKGLREDGKTTARTERFNEFHNVTVIVGGVRKELKAEHVVVRENEGPPIFDMWVVAELARPEGLYRFYQEIGTFSDPVIAEVMKLPGFPVEISATVDDGNNRKTFHTKIVEIREQAVPASDFEIPADWKQVTPQDREKGPPAVSYKCVICGKTMTPGSDDDSRLWPSPFEKDANGNPLKYPVCGDEHRVELIKRLANGTAPQPPK